MPVRLLINSKEATNPKKGTNIFEAAEEIDIRVPSSCRKQGKCRECLVEVIQGEDLLSPRTFEEEHLKGSFRLSCRAHIAGESGIVRCHTMRSGTMQMEDSAIDLPGNINGKRLLVPAVTRDGDRILLDGDEIAVSSEPIHGIAMDLGTTTIVVRLLNLETGELIATSSFENPQRFGGSDVMSRIQYDTDHPDKLLQKTLLGYLTRAIKDLPVDPKTIYELVVAGNLTMRDIFFGLNVYSIGQKPYRSQTELDVEEGKETSTSYHLKAKELRIPIHPKARIYGTPLISGHVGADASVNMLAIDLANEEKTIVLMDIGTNTEIIIGNKDKIMAASCPAGPAFEGGAITCGMPGLDGAIDTVSIDPSTGKADFHVIGDRRAQGICGSGLIDILSELRKTELINELGRFEEIKNPYDIDKENGISFSESDINELAQAKGANVAGLQIVFKNYGLSLEDIDVSYLAGGFGRYINIDAAKQIGLIPNLPTEKILQVGNAAIEGATIALLSISRRKHLEEMVKNIEHIELETDPDFFDYFVDGCQFLPFDSTEFSS
ncbi:MAG: DUF4445 domain-containing protein [Opitutaceae bacterium]|nr:DUF4445 domain-containing protein [Opitutaceae bacterium]